jgi:S-DNA-T family DNA segregation ATPase FtsK/SpoIIIE
VPADLVLACGVFGNVTDADIVRTIDALPSLCARGATVIWTRHRRPPDATVAIRAELAAAGFEEVEFAAPDGFRFAVGVHRLVVAPPPFRRDVEMFDFVGFDALTARCAECGFAYELGRDEIPARLVSGATAFTARLDALDTGARRARPAPGVWSPLEYACHVRDVLRVQAARVDLVQREHEPELVPMGRDERAIADRYNEQDARAVSEAVRDSARDLAARLAALDADGWSRIGIYSYPVRARRTVEWIGNHTVHELQHHTADVT